MSKQTMSRSWRALNSIVLLFGFFSPWLNGCGDQRRTSGFEIVTQANPILYMFGIPVTTILFTIGIAGLIVYIGTNVIIVFSRKAISQERYLKWSFRAAVVGLIGGLISVLNADWCIVGVASSSLSNLN